MAASSISMLALLLLMSAVTPGLSTEGEGSQDHTVNALIIAMREVSRALEGFGDTVQEGLRQQRQSSDALTDLHTLTATVLRVEERINQQDGNFESLKEKIEDITKVGNLQRQLDEKTSENECNVHKVQDLGKDLDESRLYAEKLEQLVQQLNNTLESKKKDVPGWAEQPLHKIKNLVLQYSGSRDWETLWKGLDAEMDHSSEAYGELMYMDQSSGNPHWYIVYYGYTQLATLLLCAGMPVDLPDETNHTLLYGAASGGQYQFAKMLLSCGADVNVRNTFELTPVMGAAGNGNLELVKLLVQAGADTTATDVNGNNAFYHAKYYGHTAVQQYLEQFPA